MQAKAGPAEPEMEAETAAARQPTATQEYQRKLEAFNQYRNSVAPDRTQCMQCQRQLVVDEACGRSYTADRMRELRCFQCVKTIYPDWPDQPGPNGMPQLVEMQRDGTVQLAQVQGQQQHSEVVPTQLSATSWLQQGQRLQQRQPQLLTEEEQRVLQLWGVQQQGSLQQ